MNPFAQKVRYWIAQIPPGKVATYGQIARLAGKPRGAREVGRILFHQDMQGLPWQRVINSQGKISTHGLGYGEHQQALLEAEGVSFSPAGVCNLKVFQWVSPDIMRKEG